MFGVGLLVTQSFAGHARAQVSAAKPERWLVIPVMANEDSTSSDATALVTPFETSLRSAGQEVLVSAGAAAAFETDHSSEPVQLNDDEMTRLLRRVGEAARHLALGEIMQAQEAMEGVYALSGPARDFLNREAARARKIFDNCLMASYLWERSNEHQRALRQMLDCSRSFPGFRPEGRAYPPELRDLFAQATQRLGEMQSTTLLVNSGSRMGCGVRLNGIEVGKSPMSWNDVRSGMTRVQLECDPGVPGRIHEIELEPGDNRMDIDPELDRAVRTRGALWLAYRGLEARNRRGDTDAQLIAKAVHIGPVLQLWVDRDGDLARVRVRAIRAGVVRETATLPLPADASIDPLAVASAVTAALRDEGQLVAQASGAPKQESAGPRPSASDAALADEISSAREEDRPLHDTNQPLIGIPLAVLGSAGMVAGWVVYAERQDTRRALYREGIPLTQIDTFQNQGTAATLLGSLGAATLTVSEYFWLPSQQSTPTWSWFVGGAGVALAATGVGLAIAGESCDVGDVRVTCQSFSADARFGPLLAMNALPLVGVPLTYLVRDALRSEVLVSTSMSTDTASVSLSGTF